MIELLRCPETGQRLEWMPLRAAEEIAGSLAPLELTIGHAVGASPNVLLREDARLAYPVHGQIPVIMRPDALVPSGRGDSRFSNSDRRFAEAYQERLFYDGEASLAMEELRMSGDSSLPLPAQVNSATVSSFPEPADVWLDATYDSVAQEEAYRAITPAGQRTYLQLGGKGQHAVKMLLIGAGAAYSCSPMLNEQQYARELALTWGVSDRFTPLVAIAEELPFEDSSVDFVYSGGSLHHMQTDLAFQEINRVLKPDGVFAAIEPWRAPGYRLGTKILGQREHGASCTPLDEERLSWGDSVFDDFRVLHHGTLSRYGLLAASKFGMSLKAESVRRITMRDDSLSARLGLGKYGSSVAVIARKRSV